MMRYRARLGVPDERGFTLVELLVVILLIGILAAIALAVFLNQRDKGNDSSAKSNVNNLIHLVQACDASQSTAADFRNCDSLAELGTTGLDLSPTAPLEAASGNCQVPNALTPVAGGDVRVFAARPGCFSVVGVSKSGNHFWYVKQPNGVITRNCSTRGKAGCPSTGLWAG